MISFLLNKRRHSLFKDKVKGRWNYVIALLVSIAIVFSHASYPLQWVRVSLSWLVFPVAYTAQLPEKTLNFGYLFSKDKSQLIQQHIELQSAYVHLQSQLLQLNRLKDENHQLKQILAFEADTSHQMIAAKVVSLGAQHKLHELWLNKGLLDGIKLGQLVMDTQGMVGQVTECNPKTSKVLLISHAASAVPVRNQRTGETAMLTGNNQFEHLSLMHMPTTALVQPGDVLYTSGLGDSYPADFPVGVVQSRQSLPGEAFIDVHVKPLTLYDKNQYVMVISAEQKGHTSATGSKA